MEVFYQVTYVLLDFFSLYCIRLFFYSFLDKKRQKGNMIFLFYALALLLYIGPNLIFGNPGLNLVCSLFACLAMAGIFEGSIRYKLVLSLFAVILGMITELTGTLILHVTDGMETEAYALSVNTMAKLIYLIVIRTACLLGRRSKGKFYSSYYWWMILFIPLGSIYLVYRNYIWLFRNPVEESLIQMLGYICVVMVMNVLVLWLYDKLLELHEETVRTEQVRIQNACYINYFQSERQNNELLRKWKHDLKNYLFGILTLLDEGKNEEARTRIAGKAEEIRRMDAIHYSGNAVLDSILNYKLQLADEQHICLEYDFQVPDEVKVDAEDLAVLFGNSLDNALEAVKRVEEDKRRIKMRMYYERGAFVCRIQNTYQTIRREGERFLSTKTGDGQEHGIGMQSIQSIAEKYHGTVFTEAENGWFTLEIVLFP